LSFAVRERGRRCPRGQRGARGAAQGG
jgi:hypothetical protein